MKYQVSIVTVNYNTKKLLRNCLSSIIKFTKDLKYEIIVVDNASTDGSVQFMNKYKKGTDIKLIKNKENLGFAKANNLGIKKSKGVYILLINSDTELKDNVIKNMYGYMEKSKNIGVSSCKLVYPDGRVQSAGGYFPGLLGVVSWMVFQDLPLVDRFIKPFQPHKELSPTKNDLIYEKGSNFDWLAGTFFMIRRKAFLEVGYLDEDYFMYTEDVDYCYRMYKKGWEVSYNPKYEILHHKGASGTSQFAVDQEFKGIQLFFKKHKPAWQLPLVRLFIKSGALMRVLAFKVLGKKDLSNIYAKAYKRI